MMSRQFHALPLGSLGAAPRLQPAQARAQADDPARSQMTDLRHGPCVTADHLDGLDTTLGLMQRAGVHMALVADVDGRLIGHVTRDDLHGERPLQRALADRLHHDELTLQQVMTPLSAWQVLDETALDHARVGDVVATMHAQSLRYLPVVRREGGSTALVGLFSARRLEQALGMAIAPDLHSRSFAELGASLAA